MSDSMYSVLNPQYISGLIQQFPIKETLSDSFYAKKTSETLDLNWDVIYGTYPMAPITGMNSVAPICQPENIKTMKGTAAVIKHKIPIKAADMLLLRRPGTLNEKYANQMVLDYTARVNDGVDMRVEWLKMQALKGVVTYSDDETGISFTVDYGFRASHKITLTGDDKWDALTTGDPLANVFTWSDLVEKDGGAVADKLIMNKTTLLKMIESTKVRDLLKYDGGTVDLFAKVKTYLAAINIELVIASGMYTDSTGTNYRLVADGDVFVIASKGNSSAPSEATCVWIDAPNEYTMNVGKFGETIEIKDPKSTQILAGQYGFAVVQFPDRIVYAKVF
ncbi:MAG TPA: major capsid protein [Bacteroidales bacterium]|nr:major capsid protein [Bacteroidales bacterium]